MHRRPFPSFAPVRLPKPPPCSVISENAAKGYLYLLKRDAEYGVDSSFGV